MVLNYILIHKIKQYANFIFSYFWFMQAFINGFLAFFQGIKFSFKHFRIWYLVPICLWLLFAGFLIVKLGRLLIPYFLELIESSTGLKLSNESATDSFEKFLKIGISWGVILIVKILIWYAISRCMKYFVLIVLAPLYAYISEKTEEIFTGKSYPFNLIRFMNDVFRGIRITIRNMIIETVIIILGGILSFFIPFISPLLILALFLVNCYFMAFNFFDYIAERKRMNISKSIQYMRSNKNTLLGFGFAYNLVALIPFVNWIIAPISAASGAVIADKELPENLSSGSFKFN
jgi:CysZ protein